jgi:hypothetical protein
MPPVLLESRFPPREFLLDGSASLIHHGLRAAELRMLSRSRLLRWVVALLRIRLLWRDDAPLRIKLQRRTRLLLVVAALVASITRVADIVLLAVHHANLDYPGCGMSRVAIVIFLLGAILGEGLGKVHRRYVVSRVAVDRIWGYGQLSSQSDR